MPSNARDLYSVEQVAERLGLQVPDVRRTVEWYTDVGFEITTSCGNHGDGLSFAIASLK